MGKNNKLLIKRLCMGFSINEKDIIRKEYEDDLELVVTARVGGKIKILSVRLAGENTIYTSRQGLDITEGGVK